VCVCVCGCAFTKPYSRSMMEGIVVNNTTIFVIYNKVSTTCFGHFLTDHHQVGYNVNVLLTAIPSIIDLL
jgi:hypothetical protein